MMLILAPVSYSKQYLYLFQEYSFVLMFLFMPGQFFTKVSQILLRLNFPQKTTRNFLSGLLSSLPSLLGLWNYLCLCITQNYLIHSALSQVFRQVLVLGKQTRQFLALNKLVGVRQGNHRIISFSPILSIPIPSLFIL